MPVSSPGAGLEDIVTAAVGAVSFALGPKIEIDPGMTKRTVSAIAGDAIIIDSDSFQRLADRWHGFSRLADRAGLRQNIGYNGAPTPAYGVKVEAG
jgi:hypothetical protein